MLYIRGELMIADKKIGYRLKKTNSDKYRSWISYDIRREQFYMDSERWCVLFSSQALHEYIELIDLINDGTLTIIETEYMSSPNDRTRIIVLNNESNVDYTRWQIWDWEESSVPRHVFVSTNDH